MNNFRLPYHLIVQEGIFEHVDEVMSDCVPDIKMKKVIIVTDENLQKILQAWYAPPLYYTFIIKEKGVHENSFLYGSNCQKTIHNNEMTYTSAHNEQVEDFV